jgi:AraC family transcriptional activator of pobA
MKLFDPDKNGFPVSGEENPPYHVVKCSFEKEESVVLKKGFFIILVANGTALLSNNNDSHLIRKNDLIILTPSMTNTLHEKSSDFAMTCIYIYPDYFDTLSDGQAMYHQLARFINKYNIPALHLETDTFCYLQQTAELFSDKLKCFRIYQNSITSHLCNFLLLQIADILYRNTQNASVCIKRTDEIFRNFKKLLINNYKRHHDILFYANKLNISTTYLSRIVKRTTGRTVRFHVSELLCAEARRLLESTDMGIKEIADNLGFSDQSVFGKFFVKMTGVSPLKYRKR